MFRKLNRTTFHADNVLAILKPKFMDCSARYMSTTVHHRKDMIGPPDKISNLRPIKFHIFENESVIDKEFRLERQKVQEWNENFWVKHNLAFMKEIEKFRQQKLKASSDSTSLSAEEMSEFYKDFLDRNWRIHVAYNFEWYLKNVYLVFLDLKVKIKAIKNN